jgi:hypothetical protein
MYLLNLYYENAKKNKTGELVIPRKAGKIPKWTILPSNPAAKELLQMIVLAVTNPRFIQHIPYPIQNLCHQNNFPLKLEFIISRHPETEGPNIIGQLGSGIALSNNDTIKNLRKNELKKVSNLNNISKISSSSSLNKYFILAHGPELSPHINTDDFEFNNPFLRVTRFHSLFNKRSKLTDPIAFLNLLQYRGIRCKRFLPLNMLKDLCQLAAEYLEIETAKWLEPKFNFENEWLNLKTWQKKILSLVLDICRHLLDAFPSCKNTLKMPGVILLHRPDLLSGSRLVNYLGEFLDNLFPRMQFIVSLSEKNILLFPNKLKKKCLQLPETTLIPQKKKPVRKITPGSILLIDVDGKLPNLALMKLSSYYKDKGKKVILQSIDSYIKGADRIFASSIFHRPSSARHIKKLKNFYGESLICGGSGVDIKMRLPKNIEQMPADYTLYPELGNRAIGFITRGCPFNCSFCLVPEKEGKPRQADDLDSLLQNGRDKLILLDDNILAHPNANDFLEEFALRNIMVNFTQTLDINLIDREKAKLIKRVNCSNIKFTRNNYHFSLNDNKRLEQIKENYDLFDFSSKDNVGFVCMYGFNTTLAQDVERFHFLRSLPGAYVFMQQYQPVPNGPQPRLKDFFNEKCDEYIDKLIRILFPQNMKSMEKYYRWLSKLYSIRFGKVHMGLVDTIFKYNKRHYKGEYIATLSGTRTL